jgi:hypothetical protein
MYFVDSHLRLVIKQEANSDLHLDKLRNDVMRWSQLKHQDFRETLGHNVVLKEYALAKHGDLARNRSLIKIGRSGTSFELKSAAFTDRSTIAVMARPVGSLGEFTRYTLYPDSKYQYLAWDDRDFNDWLDYRNKLRDIRYGYKIGSHDRLSKTRMMISVIQAFRGKGKKINTNRHETINSANEKLLHI